MKSLDIQEQHGILIKIAAAIDEICSKEAIPYYIVYGTLLGAIRHKGFIPWDDDMDICVPLEHYNRFVSAMEKHLPMPYRCCTYKNSSGCCNFFAKISDLSTIIIDPRPSCKDEEQIGLNIDVFPLVSCEINDEHLKKALDIRAKCQKVYYGSTNPTIFKTVTKKILQKFYRHSRIEMLDMIWKEIYKIQPGNYVNTLAGVYGEREYIPAEWFYESKDYEYEGVMLKGPLNAHDILHQIYNNYMELPPADKRKVHVSEAYYRKQFVKINKY